MKTIFTFIVLFVLSSTLFTQTEQPNFSICGSIDELPTSIVPLDHIGGFINCAKDDGNGNVFFPQGNVVHNAHLNGAIGITYSVPILEEAFSIDYNNGRLVCGTMSDYVTTFLTGSESATVDNFKYTLSGGNGIDRVDLDGDYLYITELNSDYKPSMIHILDWTTGPNSNEPIGVYNPVNANILDFAISGNTIFIVGTFNNIGKLVALDVTNKTNPVEAGSIDIENATSVGFDDVYIYVGCKSGTGNDGLKILLQSDISTIFKEAFTSLIDFDQILVRGDRLFARDSKNVIIIDITHHDVGLETDVLGQATFSDMSQWNFTIGGVDGNKLYYTNDGQFGTIDITSYTNIQLSTTYISPRMVFDQEMNNNRMVIVGDGIYSYDITDPAKPVLMSYGELPTAERVFMYEDQCFITDRSFGLHIFDVDNLTTEVGYYVSTSVVQANFIDMVFNSLYCYALCGNNLEIFSRTDDEYPRGHPPRKALSQVDLGAHAVSICQDNLLFYVAHENGITTLNISDVTNPTILDNITMESTAMNIDNDGSCFIVSSTDGASTYLSAFEVSVRPPTLLKTEKVADEVASVNDYSKVMDMVGGLIFLIVKNKVLSYVYLPATNEFAAGATYEDASDFYNIKAYLPLTLSKQPVLNKENLIFPSIFIALAQSSSGMKNLKANRQQPQIISDNTNIPDEFELYQNYPNPFNPTTTIKYSIHAFESTLHGRGFRGGLQHVTLKIYNILGQEVTTLVNKEQKPGYYSIEFNASGLASGIYFYKLAAGNFIATKKLLLLK
ncbi:MAG: T9SS type A sorting domain-containing protein [bacterium]